jgi:hypothetical protein
MMNRTVKQIVGAVRDIKEGEGGKGGETEAERRIRERTGKGRG